MKIEKLPSGSYRIRKTYQGRTYTVIVQDHKPTQKEALKLMSEKLEDAPAVGGRMTFKQAALSYIDSKVNVLSPATIRSYRCLVNAFSEKFAKTQLSVITAALVQQEINSYSRDHSAKTVRNLHGFLSAVLAMFAPEITLRTTLPQHVPSDPYIPTDDDVRRLLAAARGTRYESALMLAVFGLRRSEICALEMADIGNGVIHVNKAKVADSDGNWVVKTTKTAGSTRDVYVPVEVTDRIHEIGVFDGFPNSIRVFMYRVQDELGIPRFSLHKLRHYYASVCHYLGVPDVYIMASGGWKTDAVMKTVYRHALADKERELQEISGAHFSGLIFGSDDAEKEESA